MSGCLNHIPAHLHYNSKPLITKFLVGDIIYLRSSPEDLINPFQSISLCELSHNIGINVSSFISYENDVLINTEDVINTIYIDKVVCTLEIKSLNENFIYKFNCTEEKNNQILNADMQLIHDPLMCMYPHCIFRIRVNETVITHDNYSITMKKYNKLRTTIRQELATMIRRRAIEQIL